MGHIEGLENLYIVRSLTHSAIPFAIVYMQHIMNNPCFTMKIFLKVGKDQITPARELNPLSRAISKFNKLENFTNFIKSEINLTR